jgi:hypothetical protein
MKGISTDALEAALAAAIVDITGKDCAVSISDMRYITSTTTPLEALTFSALAACHPPEGSDKTS